ncbi:hypothetical protein Landi51_05483 [Colletotrichum acutatum]
MSTNKIWGQLQVDLTKAHPIQRITDSGDFRFVIANDFPPPQPVPWGKDQTWSPLSSGTNWKWRSHLEIIVDFETIKEASSPLAKVLANESNRKVDGYPGKGAILPEGDNVGSMFVLFAIIHKRIQKLVPVSISIEEFKSVLEHADKYGLVHCLDNTILEAWMPKTEERGKLTSAADIVWLAWIARTIGAAEVYHETIARLALLYTDLSNPDVNILSGWVKVYDEIKNPASEHKHCVNKEATAEDREKCNSRIFNSVEQFIITDGPEFACFVENEEDLVHDRGQYIGKILKTVCSTIEGHESCDPVFRISHPIGGSVWPELDVELQTEIKQRGMISGWIAQK